MEDSHSGEKGNDVINLETKLGDGEVQEGEAQVFVPRDVRMDVHLSLSLSLSLTDLTMWRP